MGMDRVHHFNEVTVAIGEGEEHEHQSPESETFKVIISSLIGVSAIAIAMVVWASGVLGNHSVAQNADGIAAAVEEQAIVSSKINALGDHVGYLSYHRGNLEGDSIFNYINSPAGPRTGPALDTLQRQMTESWDVGVGIDSFFTQRWAHVEIGTRGRAETYDAEQRYSRRRG